MIGEQCKELILKMVLGVVHHLNYIGVATERIDMDQSGFRTSKEVFRRVFRNQ